jgi:hypothetical protein
MILTILAEKTPRWMVFAIVPQEVAFRVVLAVSPKERTSGMVLPIRAQEFGRHRNHSLLFRVFELIHLGLCCLKKARISGILFQNPTHKR